MHIGCAYTISGFELSSISEMPITKASRFSGCVHSGRLLYNPSPTVIFSFVSTGIATGFVPMYSRILGARGRLEADRYTSNLSNALVLMAAIIVVFVLVLTQPVVKLFASGFTGETLSLAVKLTRISIFAVCFTGLVDVFLGYLRLHGSFVVPGLVSFPFSFAIILSLFISAKTSIY